MGCNPAHLQDNGLQPIVFHDMRDGGGMAPNAGIFLLTSQQMFDILLLKLY